MNPDQDVTVTWTFTDVINQLSEDIHHDNRERGWYDKPVDDGTRFMLMVSEIAEAMEGNRKDLTDEHIPHRSSEEVELADAVIRILDYAGYKGLDIGGAIEEKLAYNRIRSDHSREERAKVGGKKF